MASNLFGNASKNDIRVGYVDPQLGYVTNVSVCEANDYAKKNPGTIFIFKDGKRVLRYLNINEVNKLTPKDLESDDKCEGVNQKKPCGPPIIQIYGGGGIGAQANPVIGIDGSLLAVDLVRGGHGYQYPPQVSANDNCNYGSGAVLNAEIGDISDGFETYTDEEDFEEYELCDPNDIGYGRIYGPNGEDLGPWEPSSYTNIGKDPIREEIIKYQDIVRRLSRAPFWSTRLKRPTKIISNDSRINPTQVYNVTDASFLEKQRNDGVKNPIGWSDYMNSYAISPVPPSNVRGSDYAATVFTMEWNEQFPVTGEYIFRGLCDNHSKVYLDNQLVFDPGGFAGPVNDFRKTISEGLHNIRVDLVNLPIYEKVSVAAQSQPTRTEEQRAGSLFIKEGDNYYMLVGGNDLVQIDFLFNWSGTGSPAITAVTKVIIQSEQGPIVFERSKSGSVYTTNGEVRKSGVFKNGNKYLVTFEGLPKKTTPPAIVDTCPSPDCKQAGIVFQDANDSNPDYDASFQAIGAKQLSPPRVVESAPPSVPSTSSSSIKPKKVFNTIDYIDKANRTLWRTNVFGRGGFINEFGVCPFDTTKTLKDNPYAGTHRIIWSNINFPVSGNYKIRIGVDDNVTLRIGDKITIRKEGFRPNTSISTGELNESRFIEAGTYQIIADLEQIPGGRFTLAQDEKANPMALAIDIQIDIFEGVTISPKSWNENPMGVAITIDAPEPSIPQEPVPQQEGRCPNNPIWTTRFPTKTEKWYPVRFSSAWSGFMNRYAISPVKPLDTPGSDKAGSTYSTSWEVNLPYDGFYAIKGTRDNTGRILIDNKEVSKLDGFNVATPKLAKVFLTKGLHTITAEVTNTPIIKETTIDQKIFSTKDWQVALNSTTSAEQPAGGYFWKNGNDYYLKVGGNDLVGLKFEMAYNDNPFTAGTAITKITIPSHDGKVVLERQKTGSIFKEKGSVSNKGIFKANQDYGPIVFEGNTNKVSQPQIVNTGNPQKDPGSFQQRINFFDGDGNDVNATITLIPPPEQKSPNRTTEIPPQPPASRDGVTYEGPILFHYRDNRWGSFMNEYSISPYLPPLDKDNTAINGKKTYIWRKVKFPETGQYRIAFNADNSADLYIAGVKILSTSNYIGAVEYQNINITAGTYDIVVYMENIPDFTNIFYNNPVGFALDIRKNITQRTQEQTPWSTNPMGISAILIPPPCPKKISGRGVVTKIAVQDPGNGFLPPSDQGSYPATLRLKEVIVENPGINYNCGVDKIQITPSNGAILDYVCDSFGKIKEVKVLNSGIGFTAYPSIEMVTPAGVVPTGINASFRPQFEVIRDPIVTEPAKLIQVTDLVGLKQNGYIFGRAYYGSVFYKDGVRYAGFYETPGQLVQVYDTLQESINAQVTTTPSAIERSGTDTELSSNNPKLNLPGTPENLI